MLDDLEAILWQALDKLHARDSILLADDTAEWAISHRLAIYLEECLPGWNVDCEYNRQGADGTTKTRALDARPDCCFEVDEYDPATADWASVMAWGRARRHATPAAWDAMKARFGHVLHRVIRADGDSTGALWCIDVTEITGRRGP